MILTFFLIKRVLAEQQQEKARGKERKNTSSLMLLQARVIHTSCSTLWKRVPPWNNLWFEFPRKISKCCRAWFSMKIDGKSMWILLHFETLELHKVLQCCDANGIFCKKTHNHWLVHDVRVKCEIRLGDGVYERCTRNLLHFTENGI